MQDRDATLVRIAELEIELAKTTNYIFDIYVNNSCISNNDVDSACVETIAWDEDGQQARMLFGDLQVELLGLEGQLLSNILNSCQNIVRLQNPSETKDEENDNGELHEEDPEN